MKIPKLQSAVSALLPKAQFLATIPADEVISMGCAKQSSYLCGNEFDDVAAHVDIEITTLAEDVSVRCVDGDNQAVDGAENEVLFRKGAPVPTIHAATLKKEAKAPVKLAVQQGDHIDYVENPADSDLHEIVARLHGGVRENGDKSHTIEPTTIHLHLN